jgi:hypothetical protein
MLNHHHQLMNQTMRDSTAYGEYLKMNSALSIPGGSAIGPPPYPQADRHLNVGGAQLHEKDVHELHNLIEFMKFAIEASEEMKALWTAFVVARKLEN